jgi:hypothetical protein
VSFFQEVSATMLASSIQQTSTPSADFRAFGSCRPLKMNSVPFGPRMEFISTL